MRFIKKTDARKTASKRPARSPSRHLRKIRPGVTAFVVLMLAVTGATGVFGWTIYRSGAMDAGFQRFMDSLHQELAANGLAVREILVSGRNRTDRSVLLQAIGTETGDPILAIDLEDMHARIAALSWTRQVQVERHLPDTIFVRLVEREPVAVWQHQRTLTLIDFDGTAIHGVDTRPYSSLPLVIGEQARAYAGAFLNLLGNEPGLRKRVRAITRIGRRRWDVRFDNDIDVQLPEQDPLDAWSELARVERKTGILQRDVMTIDMRVQGQLVVRVAPATARRLRNPGRRT